MVSFKCRFHIVKDVDIFFYQILLGGDREGGIPDPIPNSEVKPLVADGTVHKSTEE